MPNNLTPEQLEQWEQLCERANKPPWFTKETPKKGEWPTCSIVAATSRGQNVYCQPDGGIYPANNQDFIATARAAMPTLIKEVKRLRKYNANIVEKCEQYWNEHNINDAEVHCILEQIHRWAHGRDT